MGIELCVYNARRKLANVSLFAIIATEELHAKTTVRDDDLDPNAHSAEFELEGDAILVRERKYFHSTTDSILAIWEICILRTIVGG